VAAFLPQPMPIHEVGRQPISTGNEMQVSFPMAGDFDFMCINTDKSLAPIIMPADIKDLQLDMQQSGMSVT